jgi:hypothetical protein
MRVESDESLANVFLVTFSGSEPNFLNVKSFEMKVFISSNS